MCGNFGNWVLAGNLKLAGGIYDTCKRLQHTALKDLGVKAKDQEEEGKQEPMSLE